MKIWQYNRRLLQVLIVLISSCTTIYHSGEIEFTEDRVYFILKVESDFTINELFIGRLQSAFITHPLYLDYDDLGEYIIVEGRYGQYGISSVNKHKLNPNLLSKPEILFEVLSPGIYYIGDYIITKSDYQFNPPQIPMLIYDLQVINNFSECVDHFQTYQISSVYNKNGIVFEKSDF